MLDAKPSFERIAINRVTFGARDVDVSLAQSGGWAAWVSDQLNPPAGDDADLAAHLRAQTMHIEYPAENSSFAGTVMKWDAVNEDRPLNYLGATTAQLYNVAINRMGIAFAEVTRVQQEQVASKWIRDAHSRYQLREFMTDFWLNHFSINRAKGNQTACTLLAFERDIIRANALGNFASLVAAVAASPSMLIYLDNADSQASLPNENYARELMELHTLGQSAYFGKDFAAAANAARVEGLAPGFTDDDIIQASRALSGWTIKNGQMAADFTNYPQTGEFVFNAQQHNTQAGMFLGINLGAYGDAAQGKRVVDLVATHPAAADFIVGKMCRRIFGDSPPPSVIARATTVWLANRDQPDQIKRVMSSILLDGPEIGAGPQVKMRRPYERMIALFRTTDTVVSADPWYIMALDPMNDTPFIWPSPDGRPDNNAFWLNTFTQVTLWNFLKQIHHAVGVRMNVFPQPPKDAMKSVPALVDYWVGRMVGYQLGNNGAAIIADSAANHSSPLDHEDDMIARVIYMIAAAPEFAVR